MSKNFGIIDCGGLRGADFKGDVTTGSVMAGQSAAMIREELSCREVIDRLMQEMTALLKQGAGSNIV